MRHSLDSLRGEHNTLAPHYRAFRVSERLLLTGHSHQAWPDCAREGLEQCFHDAATEVDDKWGPAFEKAERVRRGIRAWLSADRAPIALADSTHALLVRFLSALPLARRPRIVTTSAEFHSLRRQLGRLAEEGIDIVSVACAPIDSLAERMIAALAVAPDRTACVMLSSVLFTTSEIVEGLPLIASACARSGTELFIDAYHHLGVLPFDMTGLEAAFIVGGGYKYLELGEGNCFLRVPEACTMRPVITGWFAEFGTLDRPVGVGTTPYAAGDARFAGSTYDPASHYRGARVLDFFDAEELTPAFLREVSQHQVGRLMQRFAALDVDPRKLGAASPVTLSQRAGFLALTSPHAAELVKALRTRGVFSDSRGEILRLGPAPYLCDAQLDASIEALAECVASIS
jgi:kynureninase